MIKRLIEILSEKNTDLRNNYSHLFQILEMKHPDNLDWVLEEFQKDMESNEWFITYHKSLRQSDVFDGYSVFTNKPDFTSEDRERLTFLDEKMKNRPENWVELPEYGEYADESRKLRAKQFDDGFRSIGGHLDMLLYNSIHMDKDDELMYSMKRIFEERLDIF